MTTYEAITVAAILAGPLMAVLVTRYLDDRRERHDRRMSVFRTLMRTRRTPVHVDHVGALNLIEIEFSKDRDVVAAWRRLLEHFASNHTRKHNEETPEGLDLAEKKRRDEDFDKRLGEERARLLAKLLHAMGKALGFRIEQLEIFEGGYTPQGWANNDMEQQMIRRFVLDLYRGERHVPVGVVDFTRLSKSSEQAERCEKVLAD